MSGLSAQARPSARYITLSLPSMCMRKKLPLLTFPQPWQTQKKHVMLILQKLEADGNKKVRGKMEGFLGNYIRKQENVNMW